MKVLLTLKKTKQKLYSLDSDLLRTIILSFKVIGDVMFSSVSVLLFLFQL